MTSATVKKIKFENRKYVVLGTEKIRGRTAYFAESKPIGMQRKTFSAWFIINRHNAIVKIA